MNKRQGRSGAAAGKGLDRVLVHQRLIGCRNIWRLSVHPCICGSVGSGSRRPSGISAGRRRRRVRSLRSRVRVVVTGSVCTVRYIAPRVCGEAASVRRRETCGLRLWQGSGTFKDVERGMPGRMAALPSCRCACLVRVGYTLGMGQTAWLALRPSIGWAYLRMHGGCAVRVWSVRTAR